MNEFWWALLSYGGVALCALGLGFVMGYWRGYSGGDRRWR